MLQSLGDNSSDARVTKSSQCDMGKCGLNWFLYWLQTNITSFMSLINMVNVFSLFQKHLPVKMLLPSAYLSWQNEMMKTFELMIFGETEILWVNFLDSSFSTIMRSWDCGITILCEISPCPRRVSSSHAGACVKCGFIYFPKFRFTNKDYLSRWISIHMSSKVWVANTYTFPKSNGCTIAIWEWITIYLIQHFMVDVITYPGYSKWWLQISPQITLLWSLCVRVCVRARARARVCVCVCVWGGGGGGGGGICVWIKSMTVWLWIYGNNVIYPWYCVYQMNNSSHHGLHNFW